MQRLLLASMLALASAAAAAAQAPSCDSLDSVRWLLGDWTADDSTTTFHESWTEVTPHTFEGAGMERAKLDGSIKVGEVLRLVEMAGAVFYISKVAHNELPVAFRLNECADGRYVFDNPTHDFPRRLEYRREADGRLTVRVSDGADQGFTLEYRRADSLPDLPASVLAAEDARFAAMVAGVAVEMRGWLADDLEYVHSSGLVESREQLIESITSGRTRYVAVTPDERRVVPLGAGAALVRGRGRFRVETGGSGLDLQIRYLAVYGIRDGVWQLRSWQSLRTP